MSRWRLLLVLPIVVVVALSATPASAQTVAPKPGEGLIQMTQRICGSSSSWKEQAARNGLSGNYWLYMGHVYNIECLDQPGVQLPDPPAPIAAAWVNPLPGTCRPSTGGGQFGAPRNGYTHQGIDLGGIEGRSVGTPVHAAHDGLVTSRGYFGNAGNQLQIRSADGVYVVKYNHLNSFAVSQGQWVRAGDVIGGMGKTGNATGPHLHVEIWSGGKLLNPTNILPVRC